MSYTEMFKVPEVGPVENVAEFKNAFRGAWMVWEQMTKRYLHSDGAIAMLRGEMQATWDLWKDKSIPLDHRIVLAMTFDKVMVRRENLGRLIEAIESYAKAFDPGHLLLQAQKLRELVRDSTVYAVCWNQTSVNCDSWWIYEDSEDEDESGRPYDISKDADHWFLFDDLT